MLEKLKKKLNHAGNYSKWTTTATGFKASVSSLPFTASMSFFCGSVLTTLFPILVGGSVILTAIVATAGLTASILTSSTALDAIHDFRQQRQKVTFENDVGQVIQSSATQKAILKKAERNIRDVSRILECAETEFKRAPLRIELSEAFAAAQNISKNVVVLEAGIKGASASEYNYQTHKSPSPVSFFKAAA